MIKLQKMQQSAFWSFLCQQYLYWLKGNSFQIWHRVKLKCFLCIYAVFIGGTIGSLPAKATEDLEQEPSMLGGYLAGSVAAFNNDFESAVHFLEPVYQQDKNNLTIRNQLIASYLALDGFSKAFVLVDDAIKNKYPIGALEPFFQQVIEAKRGLLRPQNITGKDFVQDVVIAWGFARNGNIEKAIARFDGFGKHYGQPYLQNIFAGLSYAMVGDFERAAERFETAFAQNQMAKAAYGQNMVVRHKIAYMQVLSQLGRNADAVKFFDDNFVWPIDLYLQKIRKDLAANISVPFELVSNANAFLSEIYLSISEIMQLSKGWSFALAYARAAEFIKEDNLGALMASAHLIANAHQPQLALDIYKRVAEVDSIFKTDALLGWAKSLSDLDNIDGAIELLQKYTQSEHNDIYISWALGDYLQMAKRYPEAIKTYSRAIEIFDNFGESRKKMDYWRLYYGRGISYERTENWSRAEEDFRKALKMNPNEASVLNYLGYSLVERREKLTEALELIQRAVVESKNSGHVTDSLAWAYFRLGKFEKAVPIMERAAELLPTDPIVCDHLGDVYWAVGREREAIYQWKRALLFNPEPEEETRIHRKLEIGLDEVLVEEGAKSLDDLSKDVE